MRTSTNAFYDPPRIPKSSAIASAAFSATSSAATDRRARNAASGGNLGDHVFQMYLNVFQGHAASFLEAGGHVVYTTDADPAELWNEYLLSFPVKTRQYHNCNCCRRFIQTYGGLVVMDEGGNVLPLFFSQTQSVGGVSVEEARANLNVRNKVLASKVNGVFYSTDKVWGNAKTGNWTHLSFKPSKEFIKASTNALKTPYQLSAEKKEDFRMLNAAIADYSPGVVNLAVSLLESDSLYRSEKVLGIAKWFQGLMHTHGQGKQRREESLWRAVATAPVGFCHIRSSMIGTLLDDLKDGMGMDSVKRRFAEKMNPLQYQRPTAAPSAQQTQRADKIFEELGLAPALRRRMATLDDVQEWLWLPKAPALQELPKKTTFSHLRTPAVTPLRRDTSRQKMTFAKFIRTYGSSAESIKVQIKSSDDFVALTAAELKTAPPVLQWDSSEQRNQVAWYRYSGRSTASRWGLRAGSYCEAVGITALPWMWNGGMSSNQSEGAVLLLSGARDSSCTGLCLFPETLRSELHEVRKTIEAHSHSGRLVRPTGQLASGLGFGPNSSQSISLEVTQGGVIYSVEIDRWD